MLLEEFITSKLECALKEVTSESRADASQESTCALSLNDFSETSYQASIVCDGVELNSGLNTAYRQDAVARTKCEGETGEDLHVDGSEATMGDRTADGTSEGLSKLAL